LFFGAVYGIVETDGSEGGVPKLRKLGIGNRIDGGGWRMLNPHSSILSPASRLHDSIRR
jgi:hypothetical protein